MTRRTAVRAAAPPRAGDSAPAAPAHGEGWSAGCPTDRAGGTDRVCTEGGARDAGAGLGAGTRSVRHPAHGRRGRRAAKSRSGAAGYGWAVSLRTPEPGGDGGDGVRDEPGHALRPWAPGTCLTAAAPRDGGRRDARSRSRQRASGGASAGPAGSAPVRGRRRGPAGGRGNRILRLVIAQRRGVGFAEKGRSPGSCAPTVPLAAGRNRRTRLGGARGRSTERQLPEVAREEAFRCALCSWF